MSELARDAFIDGMVAKPGPDRTTGPTSSRFTTVPFQFREHAEEACADFCITKPTDPSWPSFAARLSFGAAEPDNPTALVEAVQRAEKEIGGTVRRLYHLAVPPAAFTSVVRPMAPGDMANEIRSRIANFRAHQERFNREREAYFSATLAKLRAAIDETDLPPSDK